MERRLQNSLWALGAALTAALLLSSLQPVEDPAARLVVPEVGQASFIATSQVDADQTPPTSPRRHKPLGRHGLSMPYFSFSSSIGG